MKLHKKVTSRKLIGLALLVILSGLATLLLLQISAGSGSISVNRSTPSVQVGRTFTSDVIIDVDAPVTIAQASVSYDRNVLRLNDVSYAGSPLGSDSPEAKNSPGSLTISRYKVGSPYPSGRFTLATLTFTALSAGDATISINSNESILFEDSQNAPNILTQASGTTVRVTTPQASNPIPAPPTASPPPTANSKRDSNSNRQPVTDRNALSIPPNQDTDTSDESTGDAVPATISASQPPNSTLPEPGSSTRANQPSIAERLIEIGKSILPVMLLVAIATIIGWAIYARSGHRTHYMGGKPVQTAGPGVVFDGSHTIKTNQDNNQQPPSPVQ